MKILTTFFMFLILLTMGCGGDTQDENSSSKSSGSQAPAESVDLSLSKGVGPIESVDLAELDPATAGDGAKVFEAKCTACHKMEERYVGPALKGVTQRRTPEWILNMVLNPDKMVMADPAAKKLLTEYIAPMTNQNLTEEEAKSILAYFLEYDKSPSE
jgi:cytochrome c